MSAVSLSADLWRELLPSYEPPALDVRGHETQLPSCFRVERLAAGVVGASHSAASYFQALQRNEPPQDVAIDVRSAAIAFRSERYLRVEGRIFAGWAPLSGDYLAGDGRWVRLHCNFAHHAAAAARALGCAENRDAFTAAVAARSAFDVESAVVAQGGASGAARTHEEWLAHPHAAAIRALPLISVERVGSAPPALRKRPIRVLDLTRVIAGPLAGKVLAAYGADVIHVSSSRLPTIEAGDIDHGFGKRASDIDIVTSDGADTLRRLIAGADVLLQSYRPGALERYGFGFDDVRKIQPNIVYLSLSAYGETGPWGGRRGFDSIVQMTSGIALAPPDAVVKPHPLPCQALDHATGYLSAFGVMSALIRRATEGGAWHLRVALARTAELLWSLGFDDRLDTPDPSADDVADVVRVVDSGIGRIQYVPIPGTISDRSFDWLPPLSSEPATGWN